MQVLIDKDGVSTQYQFYQKKHPLGFYYSGLELFLVRKNYPILR